MLALGGPIPIDSSWDKTNEGQLVTNRTSVETRHFLSAMYVSMSDASLWAALLTWNSGLKQ